ncbi:MAG TPA: nickel-responsive transcriptional regulator NikR [Thermoplasmata archaeon]|nr:nickel-responsive transcriptional regulator NikR [Thermoplasmata archaeon]HUJ78145.1 nickel-responsive transcriptional regulator NikR [Thermoplasmata archaeon]
MPDRVVRLGVSLEPALARALDAWVERRHSKSRSEAIRFLVRQELSDEALRNPDADVVGIVMLLYRHDAPNVLARLVAAQHRWGEHIRSSTHVHLDGDVCLESLVLVGRGAEVTAAAEELRGIKGLRAGRAVLSSPTPHGGATGHRHPHRKPAPARPGTSRRGVSSPLPARRPRL